MDDEWHDLDLSGLAITTHGAQGRAKFPAVGQRSRSNLRSDLRRAAETGTTFDKSSPRSGNSASQDLKRRLRQGLQPRRHLPSPSRVEAIAQWQANTLSRTHEDESGDLEFTDSLPLVLKHDQRTTVPKTIESDNEEWGGESLGIRRASRRSRSDRESMSSSILTSSNESTVDSLDALDGLELPSNEVDLQNRFRQTAERRAAGDTIRFTKKTNIAEDLADGLVINANSFAKMSHTIRASRPSVAASTQRAIPASKGSKAFPDLGAEFDSSAKHRPMATGKFRHGVSDQDIDCVARYTSRTRTQARGNMIQSQQTVEKPNTGMEGNARDTLQQRVQPIRSQGRPAFLPTGTAVESSHHASVRAQRTMPLASEPQHLSPAKRRATASEALRLEAARLSARAHVRAKTYGEGYELDHLDDLPIDATLVHSAISRRDHNSSDTPSPLIQRARLARYKDSPQPDMVRAGTAYSPRHRTHGAPDKDSHRQETAASRARITKRKKVALPGLISGINTAPAARTEKNMIYNPKTYRWEGNEQDMNHFDAVLQSPPRPALIAPMHAAAPGMQVSKGMVFDPEQMCWVKLSDDDSEADPFEAIDDLEVAPLHSKQPSIFSKSTNAAVQADQFSVGEEFDVGRQFIRRQKEEESRWRSQARGWFEKRPAGMSRQYLQEIYILLTEDE